MGITSHFKVMETEAPGLSPSSRATVGPSSERALTLLENAEDQALFHRLWED